MAIAYLLGTGAHFGQPGFRWGQVSSIASCETGSRSEARLPDWPRDQVERSGLSPRSRLSKDVEINAKLPDVTRFYGSAACHGDSARRAEAFARKALACEIPTNSIANMRCRLLKDDEQEDEALAGACARICRRGRADMGAKSGGCD